MRIFEQAVLKTLLNTRGRLAHDARQQPDAGVKNNHRGDFAARENIIADGNLLETARFDNALVDALESSADEDNAFAGCKRLDPRLTQDRPPRAEQQTRPWV